MPKKRRRSQPTKKLPLNVSIVKEEYIIQDVQIKIEPIDSGYDGGATAVLPTQIYTAADENWASIEAETGFVSHLDIVKTEVDVDEATVKALRDMMQYQPQEDNEEHIDDIAPPKKKRKVDAKKKKKKKTQKKKVENKPKISSASASAPTGVDPTPLELTVNGVKVVKCLFCDFQLTRRDRSLVKEHMRIHTGYMPFACMHCPEKFHIRGTLLRHIQVDHRSKAIYQCPRCRVHYFTKKDFEAHEFNCVKLRSFECHLCKIQMKRLFMHEVKDHMRRKHTGECVHQCQHCDEIFVSTTQLSSHLKRHHLDVMSFQCSLCKDRFATEEKWKKHEEHCLNKISYQCHLCQYTYPNVSFDAMKLHMRKHTGE